MASARDDGPGLGLPYPGPAERRRLLGPVLRDVSRSFYLTLRVLPAPLREPIGLAYLLARAADTIADSRALTTASRLTRLLAFRDLVRGPADQETLESITQATRTGSPTAEELALLDSLPQAFACLEGLEAADQERVRSVVVTLTLGMETDLTVFPSEDSGAVAALPSAADLDRYVYLVAGCVGEFWTGVTVAHEPRLREWREAEMSAIGVGFGKALQLTNVLRDVPRDLRMGRCYLPADELAGAGLLEYDLLDPAAGQQARQVVVPWVQQALEHFNAAECYLLATPRRCLRLRLAVLWPILLGLATLSLLVRNEHWLDPEQPSRVSRRWVYWMMARSAAVVSSDALLRRWIGSLRQRVQTGL